MNHNSRRNVRVRAAILTLLGLTAACGAVTESVRSHHIVSINFSSTGAGAVFQSPYVSVVDTVILTATARSTGQSLTRRARLARRDSIASFTLPLEAGDWGLEASVVSNSGVQLYFGATHVAVADSDVSADLFVSPVAPVLLVAPDSARSVLPTDGVGPASAYVFNRGLNILDWSIPDTVPPDSRTQCGAAGCVSVSPAGGRLGPRDSVALYFTSQSASFKLPITFIVKSSVGSVPLVVRPLF